MNDFRRVLAITVAIVATSCSNAPTSSPAGNTDSQAYADEVLVILPTTTKGIVRGFVRDIKTNDPIHYANVMVVGTTLGAMSIKSGEFAISGVIPGVYQVKAMMLGYKSATIDSVIVTAGKETHISLALLSGNGKVQ